MADIDRWVLAHLFFEVVAWSYSGMQYHQKAKIWIFFIFFFNWNDKKKFDSLSGKLGVLVLLLLTKTLAFLNVLVKLKKILYEKLTIFN